MTVHRIRPCLCGHEDIDHEIDDKGKPTGPCRKCARGNLIGVPPCPKYHRRKRPDDVMPAPASQGDHLLYAIADFKRDVLRAFANFEGRVMRWREEKPAEARATNGAMGRHVSDFYEKDGTVRFIDKTMRFAQKPSEHGRVPSDIGGGELLILSALAGAKRAISRDHLTALTGYKRSTRDKYLGRLQARGMVVVNDSGVDITPSGRNHLGKNFDEKFAVTYGLDCVHRRIEQLPEGEAAILEVLAKTPLFEVSREQLTAATGYKRSTRDKYIGKLIGRRLVQKTARGSIVIASYLRGE